MARTVITVLGVMLLISAFAAAQCPTTATIKASTNFPEEGDKIIFTVNVTSECGTPSGTVTIYLTGNSLRTLGTITLTNGMGSFRSKKLYPSRDCTTEYAYGKYVGNFDPTTTYPSAPLYWDWDDGPICY